MVRRLLHLHEPGHDYTFRALRRRPDLADLEVVARSYGRLLPDDRPPPIRIDGWSTVKRAAGKATRAAQRARGRRLVATGLSPGDVVMFTDLERLSPVRCEQAARLHAAVPDRATVLNDPTRSLRRYALLRQLHESGSNTANVYRLSERRQPLRWPVFLRAEDDHQGASTKLLAGPDELEEAVRSLLAAGGHPDRHLVIEHVLVERIDGLVPKYAAFRVGPHVLPRHVLFGRDWVVKYNDQDRGRRHDEIERDYIANNPHAAELRDVFDLAGITYGRIDYVEQDGRLEVFEINTNPSLFGGRIRQEDPRRQVHETFLDRLAAAFNDLPG